MEEFRKIKYEDIMFLENVDNKMVYISKEDAMKYYNYKFDFEKILRQSNIKDDEEYILKDSSLLTVNEFLSSGIQIGYVNFQLKRVFKFLIDNHLNSKIWPYLNDNISKIKDTMPLELVDNFIDSMNAYLKLNDENASLKRFTFSKDYIDQYFLLPYLDEIISRYKLPSSFIELVSPTSLEEALTYWVKIKKDPLLFEKNEEIELASLLYSLITNKPFKNNNDIISIWIILYYINECEFLINDNKYSTNRRNRISQEDIILAIEMIKSSSTDKIQTIIKISQLFSSASVEIEFCNKDIYLKKYKDNPTRENAINYIIEYLKSYYGYQGYYEFYGGSLCTCYKIHYHGELYDFKINVYKTMNENNILVFDVKGVAYMEAPNDLINRSRVIRALYEEIKSRSTEDISNKLEELLIKDLGPSFDIKSINFKFDIDWEVIIDPNYEW